MLKELNPTNCATSSGFDPLGQINVGHFTFAREKFVEVWVRTQPNLPLNSGNFSMGKSVSEVHARNILPGRVLRKGQAYSRPTHTIYMDRWPPRVNFKAHVERVRNGRKITLAGVANGLGISRSYLTQLLYTEKTRPELELVERMSAFFECPASEFIVDAVARPEGVEAAARSPKALFISQLIIRDMQASDLSESDIEELWEDFQRGLSRIRKRKA